MAHVLHRAGCVGWRVALVLVMAGLPAGVAFAADVHFPKPLHLTRRIEDPIANVTITVDEYCAGNRVVTVRGDRVVIADYERQEVTEIDRVAGTYSLTRFDEIARVSGSSAPQKSVRTDAARVAPPVVSRGIRRNAAGRDVEQFEIAGDEEKVELGVDRSVSLNRAALDVLLGAAYPARPSRQHENLVRAAAARVEGRAVRSTAAEPVQETFGLPAEQSTTWDFEGKSITLRNVITRVGDELPPPDLIAIPPGAMRVESRFTAIPRLSEELDGRPQAKPR
jgi:hypothetical protein